MKIEENYVEVVDLDKMSHAFKIKIVCDYLKDGRDIVTAKQIDDFIKKNIEDKDELIIDMSNVNSISAKFANFLIGLHKQLKGKASITIEGVKGNKRLADLFDVFGLNSLFVVESKPTHKYTKKQITEAIAFWQKQLKMMNESTGFGRKYDHTNPRLGDKYSDSAYGPSLTWGELKEIGDRAMSDDDTVDNIALICGPDDVAFGEGICYLDVDKNVENTLVFSIAGY